MISIRTISHRLLLLSTVLISALTFAQSAVITVKNKNAKRALMPNDATIFDKNEKSTSFQYIWNELLQKHVSDSGIVNYKGFKNDIGTLNVYLKSLTDNPPEASWTDARRLVYWMNAYNAFTIKLILNHYPVESIKDIKDPWNERFIPIGDKWYTLNDIEHRIIRKMGEPRIHFALVCAAMSCPKLYNKAFTTSTLEEDLSALTKEFLTDPTKNEISENNLKLSKIFKWYGKDFKTKDQDLIDFLNQYTTVNISPKAKKSFKDYNWKLNE